MQLNITTDYAIRIIAYLAANKRIVPTKELSAAVGVTPAYVQKIMRKLTYAKFVLPHQGNAGGYTMNMDASDIRIYDVIVLMEPTFAINRCLEPDGYCNINNTANCKLHKMYSEIQKTLEDRLKAVTIADIIK